MVLNFSPCRSHPTLAIPLSTHLHTWSARILLPLMPSHPSLRVLLSRPLHSMLCPPRPALPYPHPPCVLVAFPHVHLCIHLLTSCTCFSSHPHPDLTLSFVTQIHSNLASNMDTHTDALSLSLSRTHTRYCTYLQHRHVSYLTSQTLHSVSALLLPSFTPVSASPPPTASQSSPPHPPRHTTTYHRHSSHIFPFLTCTHSTYISTPLCTAVPPLFQALAAIQKHESGVWWCVCGRRVGRREREKEKHELGP